ncbi:hypothetical protein KAR91_48110 [Candidatus Pacearchaeota archaeon]|nr:hypothetical protein [Candidatus Pacearchaeota archaeon]
MKLSFYDPAPLKNDYLTIIYLREIRKFCIDKGIPVEDISDLMAVKNSTVLANASWLEPGTITRIKENGNVLISFDINDHTYFTHCVSEKEVLYIDLIFKVAGLQKTKTSYEMVVDDDFNYSREKQEFGWGKYFEANIRPLPHPPWDLVAADIIPWENRNKLALIRGGHQYLRVHLYLQLLHRGLLDGSSMFPSVMYLHQYCDGCKQAYKDHGRITYANLTDTPCRLNGWKPGSGQWNNSCVPRYFDMAKMFNDKYGGIDFNLIEKAFAGMFFNGWLNTVLNRYLFFADFKWVYSIYAPPRFWEAAAVGTINLVPERTNDQELFPYVEEDVHYITFKEDFSDLDKIKDLSKEKFEFITQSCFEVYNTWIKPGRYRVSSNLLQHIVDRIGEING